MSKKKDNIDLIHNPPEPIKKPSNWQKIKRFLIVFLICASTITIYTICQGYDKEKKSSDDLKKEVLTYDDSEDAQEFSVDFNALLARNPDVVGWIRFDAPAEISYPVVKTNDNKFYLRHNLDKEYSINGTIFMDCNNAGDFGDSNTIIYGHNMLDDSMFGPLLRFKDESYWKESQYFYIYTPEGYKLTYHICGAYSEGPYSDIYTYKFGSDKLHQEYLDQFTSRRLYDTKLSPTITDHIVTLSTCDAHGKKRFCIQGILTDKKNLND